MRFSPLFLCLILTVAACNDVSPPSDLLEEPTYINLLVELQLLKNYQKTQQADSLAVDSLRNEIFEKYGTTKAQFERSHQFYQEDIRAQRDRIGKAIEDLRKDRLGKQDSLSVGDSTLYE